MIVVFGCQDVSLPHLEKDAGAQGDYQTADTRFIVTDGGAPCIGPDGTEIADGSAKHYYAVAASHDCQAERELRECKDGILSGTFEHSICEKPSCTGPDGSVIAEGKSKIYYSSPQSANCATVSQQRLCVNGKLSGSDDFKHPKCSISPPCKGPSGTSLAHGEERTFYSAAVTDDCSKVAQKRKCENGQLLGDAQYALDSCRSYNACRGPDGLAIAHGKSETYYSAAKATDCSALAQNRRCNDGTLSGSASHRHRRCTAFQNCTGPDGANIAHGASKVYYSATKAAKCSDVEQRRSCADGALSGSASYRYASCSAYKSCTGPDGAVIAHGASKVYYSATKAAKCSDVDQHRSCDDGALSGSASYRYASCSAYKSCTGPDGAVIAHGASKVYYSATKAAKCSDVDQHRSCDDGALSGSASYRYASCSAYKSCTGPDGANIAHGASKVYYSATKAAKCSDVDQRRSCADGALSGSASYRYASCSAYKSCTGPDGAVIAHGASKVYYSATKAAKCSDVDQRRSCSDGTLSGSASYRYASCSAYKSCTGPDGAVIAHGASKRYYSAKEATYCSSVDYDRKCTDGSLSGSSSYRYPTCYQPPATRPIYRLYNKQTGDHLLSLSSTEGTSAGYVLEHVAFRLYTFKGRDMTQVVRCRIGGDHFASLENCGTHTYEASLGWISNVATSYAPRAVYRCYNGKDHFSTTNSSECTNNGYTVEAVGGYVP
jgi:hypothetical protein